MASSKKKSFKDSYDKVLLLIAFIALIASGAFVALGMLSQTEPANLEPATRNPVPALVMADYIESVPGVLKAATNDVRVLKSELRFACVHTDCGKPVAAVEDGDYKCPFCGRAQPNILHRDIDGDGIPKGIEEAVGLDDSDPTDALEDMDGDLFSNIAEVLAGEREGNIELYKLNDPASHPAYGDYICIKNAQVDARVFVFKSFSRDQDDSIHTIGVQVLRSDRTYYKHIGDEVAGFLLLEYEGPEVHLEMGKKPVISPFDAANKKRKVLKIKELATGEILALELNKQQRKAEVRAELVFIRDPSISAWVKLDDEFVVRDEVYKVSKITRGVTLKEKTSGLEFNVRRCSEDERLEMVSRKDGTYEELPPDGLRVGEGFGDDREAYEELRSSQGIPRRFLPPRKLPRKP